MKLSFNIDDIKYLQVEYKLGDENATVKLALKEKNEQEFIAVTDSTIKSNIETPQKISVKFISSDGVYKTETVLKEIKTENKLNLFVLENPKTLDYCQNRENYRVLAEYDCIYTVFEDDNDKSYSAVTYDISVGGVSLIMDENVVSMEESSLVVMMPDRDIRSHLKFVRCEIYEGRYKLSFEFTDLSEKDAGYISDLLVKKQLS